MVFTLGLSVLPIFTLFARLLEPSRLFAVGDGFSLGFAHASPLSEGKVVQALVCFKHHVQNLLPAAVQVQPKNL